MNEIAAALLLTLLVVSFGMALRWGIKKKAKLEGRPQIMSKKDRSRHANAEFCDAVVEAVEDLVFKNRLTRAEADRRYKMLAVRCGLTDLIRPEGTPSIFDLESLKDRILIRRSAKVHKPVQFPDQVPITNGRVNHKAELARHQELLAALEKDSKLIENGIAKLTKKERQWRIRDLGILNAMTKEK